MNYYTNDYLTHCLACAYQRYEILDVFTSQLIAAIASVYVNIYDM